MLVSITDIILLSVCMVSSHTHELSNPLTGEGQHAHDHIPRQNQGHIPVHNVNPTGHPQQPSHSVYMDKKVVQDQEHIMEHLDGQIRRPEETMSEEELQFHYFKVHDYDQNNMLDGIEIISALTHHHETNSKEEAVKRSISEDELTATVDTILEESDINKDGFVDYPEFVNMQRAAQDTSG